MNKFSFDFYNRNHTLRVDMAAAGVAIAAGLLVYLSDASVLTVISNVTDAVDLDNVFLLAQPVAVGDLWFVGYPVEKDDLIAGAYLGADTSVITGEDVSVHDGHIIPAEDLNGGEVLFEVVRLGDFTAHSNVAVSINSSSGSNVAAGARVAIDGVTSVLTSSATGDYVLAANYTAAASVASLVTYKAPCVIKLI